ncbi:ABC transporter permease [Actinomadura harenae]|nr:FtsX-like permease family protein [Actinomadura harenae]
MTKVALRGLAAHKARLVLSVSAVMLSVAFVTGSLMFTHAVSGAFAPRGSTAPDVTVTAPQAGTGGDADEAARQAARGAPGGGTLPGDLLARVRRVPGVRTAAGDVTVQSASLTDASGRRIDAASGLRLSGLTKGSVPVLAGSWDAPDPGAVRLTSGHAPDGPDQVVLDRDTVDRGRLRLGDVVRVVAVPGTFQARIAGIVDFRTFSSGNTRVYVDTATAQRRLLGRPGRLTSIRVDAAPGVTAKELRDRIAAALGDTASTLARDPTGTDGPQGVGDVAGALGTWMLTFAGVAVLVGGVLIFNTFSMLVAARTRELALLRVLGADRRQVGRSVALEALTLGFLGSTLGLLAGVGLVAVLEQVIAGLGVNTRHMSLGFSATTPLAAYGVGVGVTLLAARLPARRAGRVAPMAALRDHGEPTGGPSRRRTVAGAFLLVAGVVLLALGRNAIPFGALLTLAAFVMLAPVLVLRAVPLLTAGYVRFLGPVGTLGRRNTLRQPRRTAATASALMIGVAVAAALSVMAASSRASMEARVDGMFGADYMVGGKSGDVSIGKDAVDAVRRVPGVGGVVRERVSPVTLTAGGRSMNLKLYGDDPGFPDAMRETYTGGSAADALSHGQVILVDEVARRFGVTVGSRVVLRVPGGRPESLTVGALQRQEPAGATIGRYRTAPMVGIDLLARLAPATADSRLFVSAAKGADPAVVGAALERALSGYPQVTVQDRSAYKAFVRGQTSDMLALVYGLLALTVLIAALGVVNTLALAVTERTREIGLLRAVGASRGQVRWMVRLESTLIAVLGTVLGLALGLVWGVALQHGTDGTKSVLVVPWLMLAASVAGAVLIGVAAAALPAAKAARLSILNALTHD